MEKHSVSRLSYLFAHLYLLSSDSFSSHLLSSNLPLLSASPLLCFSSVHIVGSLTSKLPSINKSNKYKQILFRHDLSTSWPLIQISHTKKGRDAAFSSERILAAIRCDFGKQETGGSQRVNGRGKQGKPLELGYLGVPYFQTNQNLEFFHVRIFHVFPN